jgi:outer membrane lipoprotein-sorting protein
MGRMKRIVALGAFALVTVVTAAVVAADWGGSWQSIRTAAQGVRTVRANFVQTRTVRILNRPIVSRGRLAYRRPDDLRWEYSSPVKSVLLLRSGSVERYIGRDEGFVRDSSAKLDAMAAVVREINLWLSGDFSASKTFRPELAEADGGKKVRLVPVDPSMRAIISRIDLVLGKTAGTVESIAIDEGSEGTTRIDFDDVRINEGVTDADFAPVR